MNKQCFIGTLGALMKKIGGSKYRAQSLLYGLIEKGVACRKLSRRRHNGKRVYIYYFPYVLIKLMKQGKKLTARRLRQCGALPTPETGEGKQEQSSPKITVEADEENIIEKMQQRIDGLQRRMDEWNAQLELARRVSLNVSGRLDETEKRHDEQVEEMQELLQHYRVALKKARECGIICFALTFAALAFIGGYCLTH